MSILSFLAKSLFILVMTSMHYSSYNQHNKPAQGVKDSMIVQNIYHGDVNIFGSSEPIRDNKNE